MTLRAYARSVAASSTVVARTVRPSSARIAPAVSPPDGAAPNAPKSTFPMDRFIAFDMRRGRVVAAAPTRVPAAVGGWLSGGEPAAAAGRPGDGVRGEVQT